MNKSEFFDAARHAAEQPIRFAPRFILLFLMNTRAIAQLFTEGDDYRILGHLNDVYRRSLEANVVEAKQIPLALAEFYLAQGRRGRLTIEEAQAGLSYRADIRLWEKFIETGADGAMVRSLISETAEADQEIASFNRLKAGIDRRAGRLDAAEEALQALHSIYARDPEARAKLASTEYELGYINFLQSDVSRSISYFQDSYVHAMEAGDAVGAWIGKCVEYRTRWLHGRVSISAARTMYREARREFLRFCSSSDRKLAARRWVMGTLLQELELEFEIGDASAAAKALAECGTPPASDAIPAVEGFLDLYEAMVALLEDRPVAVTLLEGVLEQKKAGSAVAAWYRTEAGAMDFYLLGLAHKRFGDNTKANAAWREGAAFADSMGNQTWRARCEAELEVASL